MFITALLLALHTTAAAPAADPVALLPIRAVTKTATTLTLDPDYLARAMAAQAAGDLETARREYVVAVALERDSGRLPTQAAYGLALVLNEQGKYREGAAVLEALASDASAKHDDEIEARALLDALYLNSRAHRNWQARDNMERLMVLVKSPALSPALRKRITMI
jgi:Tfp pilus assembly protein PilF